jgi:hypothetical protein
MRCRVWVDGGVVWVGPCALTPGVLLRKPLSWEMAAMIADNPDKHLPRFLRIFNEE